MTRLGGSTRVSTWRLSAGTALVAAGILTTALGTAHVTASILRTVGAGSDIATVGGLSVGGFLVPILFYTVHTQLQTPRPYARAVTIGTAIAVAGVLIVLGVTVITPDPSLVTVLAAIPYAAGVVLAVWGVVASAAARPRRPTPSYERTPTTTSESRSAADGGEDDDDLSFPLEDN